MKLKLRMKSLPMVKILRLGRIDMHTDLQVPEIRRVDPKDVDVVKM